MRFFPIPAPGILAAGLQSCAFVALAPAHAARVLIRRSRDRGWPPFMEQDPIARTAASIMPLQAVLASKAEPQRVV